MMPAIAKRRVEHARLVMARLNNDECVRRQPHTWKIERLFPSRKIARIEGGHEIVKTLHGRLYALRVHRHSTSNGTLGVEPLSPSMPPRFFGGVELRGEIGRAHV